MSGDNQAARNRRLRRPGARKQVERDDRHGPTPTRAATARAAASLATPYRYTARWPPRSRRAGRTAGRPSGTFQAPNPAGPLADPEKVRRDRSCTCSTCSPTRPGRAARRAPAGLHRHRRLRPVPADARAQRAARDGLRRVRPARRAVRRADRPAPAHDHRGEHRDHATPAAAAGAGPRRAPQRRDHRRRLLPLDAVDLPADLQLLVRRRRAAGPGRSPSWSPRSQAGERPLPDGRAWAELDAVRATRIVDAPPAGVRRPRRRSTGARAWAPCWPTRRSPPRGAATAATSRSSSATCGSG